MKNKPTRLFFSSITFIFIITSNTYSSTIYSNSNSGSDGTGNGTSSSPYQSFHKAYTMANSGDTIRLSGTFDWSSSIETGDNETTGYSLTKELTIIGEGSGNTFIQAASSAGTANRSVFTINHDITFEHLSIRYGNLNNKTHAGGGITVLDNTRDNTVIIKNCAVEYNSVNNGSTTNYYFAGGIYLRGNTSYHPDLQIIYTSVNNNSATGRAYGAGGVYSMQNNKITIDCSSFYENEGFDNSSFGVGYHNVAGGAGFFRFNRVIIRNSTFAYNTAETSGGGILLWYCISALTNNTIAYNNVTSTNGKGGGVYTVFMQQSPGRFYLKNNIIAKNTVNNNAEDLNFNTDSWNSSIFDNGTNIVETYTGSSITLSGSGTRTGNQSNLLLDSTLSTNNANHGVPTLALLEGSIAIDNGSTGVNGIDSVPVKDQRARQRLNSVDIGAYEHNGTTLPVKLSFFRGKATEYKSAHLIWETHSEVNNDRFELFRSQDGENWQKIYIANGNGNSTVKHTYDFIDRNVNEGHNYYYLKQIDFNGASEDFEPIVVKINNQVEQKIYPNPARDKIHISVEPNTPYRILDINGAVVIEGSTPNSKNIDITPLKKGIYLIQSELFVQRFIKE